MCMNKAVLVILLLLVSPILGNILTSVDCINVVENNYIYPISNSFGISMDIEEVIPEASNQLMQGLMLNSKAYGNWRNNFPYTIHNEAYAKFNCTLAEQIANTTLNCSADISNQTILS